MFEYLWALTGLVMAGSALFAYQKTRDSIHPAVVLAPLFAWFYCVWPFTLNAHGGLLKIFSAAELDYTATLFLLAVTMLCIGLLRFPRNIRKLKAGEQINVFGAALSSRTKGKIYYLSWLLGALAVSAYAYSIYNVGGFFKAYSVAKGGGYVSSGYISDAVLLSFPAVLLLAIARQGAKRIQGADIVLALVMASPHLLQGTFGGRRGPLFLSLSLLFFAWYIARGKPPSFGRVMVAVGTISAIVVVVSSQRQYIYIGSTGEFDSARTVALIQPGSFAEREEEGNEYVIAAATILTWDYWQDYRWGWGFVVNFVVRPIPKQLWPTKYSDTGGVAGSAMGDDLTQARYLEAVGFVPLKGSSTGSIADVYAELSWGVLAVFYLIGRAFSLVWRNHRLRGGMWTVVLIEMLILSVYLPSQSLSAWLQRLLYMVVITALLWKYWIDVPVPRKSAPQQATGASPRSPRPGQS